MRQPFKGLQCTTHPHAQTGQPRLLSWENVRMRSMSSRAEEENWDDNGMWEAYL